MKLSVYNELGLQRLIGDLRAMFKASGYLRVTASDSKPRSLNQNSLAHAWYAQISRELGEETEFRIKCECKLRYGVPILRADDEEFREKYDRIIRPLAYEQKVDLMALMPITSLMNTDQQSRYLECMKEGYRGRVQLEFPEYWRVAA